ncbi:MAG: YfiR/HmsC family protein [Candidatus Sericytochromatia bacterium]
MKKILLIIFSFIILATQALAENLNSASISLETKFFAKIINLSTSISNPKVGIVFEPSSSSSATYKRKLINYLNTYEIEAISVPVSSVEQAKSHGINIFYLSKGLNSIDHVARIARRDKILTFSSDLNFVEEGYSSVSVGINNSGKPKILINLTNLKKEGNSFSAKLLRLSNVIN